MRNRREDFSILSCNISRKRKKKKEESQYRSSIRKDDDWKEMNSWLDKNANAATFASTLSVTFTENQQNFIYFISKPMNPNNLKSSIFVS